MSHNFIGMIMFCLFCFAGSIKGDAYYGFEIGETMPTWSIDPDCYISTSSFSHTGNQSIEFCGELGEKGHNTFTLELPENLNDKKLNFYYYDVFGSNPPNHAYTTIIIYSSLVPDNQVSFRMLDSGWGTVGYKTENHYYACDIEAYNSTTMGPIRTVDWQKFTVDITTSDIILSINDTFTNIVTRVDGLDRMAISYGLGGANYWVLR